VWHELSTLLYALFTMPDDVKNLPDETAKAAGFFIVWWAAFGAVAAVLPVTGLLDGLLPLRYYAYPPPELGPVDLYPQLNAGFTVVSPDAVRAGGSLVAAVVYLLTLANRFKIAGLAYQEVVSRATRNVVYGFVCVIAYWIAENQMPHFYNPRIIDVVGQSLVGLLYILVFSFFTRACVLLAVNDYVNPQRVVDKKKPQRLGGKVNV
jgi:hypothetical protein